MLTAFLVLCLALLFVLVACMAPPSKRREDPPDPGVDDVEKTQLGGQPLEEIAPIPPEPVSRVGQTVRYHAHPRDAIHGRAGLREGKHLAGIITADFGGDVVNLVLTLDGQNHTLHPDNPLHFWVGSAHFGTEPGQWCFAGDPSS